MTTILGTDENPVPTVPPCECDDNGTPPHVPAIPTDGMVLWMDAASGISKTGSNVTAWVDKSSNGFTFTNIGTPTFQASSINSLPAVRCTPTNKLSALVKVLDASSECDAFVVFKLTDNAGGVLLCLGSPEAGFNPDFQYLGARYIFLDWNGVDVRMQGSADYTGTPLLHRINWSSVSNLYFELNGVKRMVVPSNFYTGPDGSTQAAIGGFTASNNSRDTSADIAEIIVYNRNLTYQEGLDVTTILMEKYGLS